MNIPTASIFYSCNKNPVNFNGKFVSDTLLKEYVASGLTNAQIGRLHGLSADAVYLMLKKAGLQSAHSLAREKTYTNIMKLYNQGLSAYSIAKSLGINDRVVLKFLKRNNYPLEKDMRHIAQIEDKTLRSIAAEMKLSKDFVDKNLK